MTYAGIDFHSKNRLCAPYAVFGFQDQLLESGGIRSWPNFHFGPPRPQFCPQLRTRISTETQRRFACIPPPRSRRIEWCPRRQRTWLVKHGMQSLGTDGETQTHALLQPTLTAVPSLLYPQTALLRRRNARGFESRSGVSRTMCRCRIRVSSGRIRLLRCSPMMY